MDKARKKPQRNVLGQVWTFQFTHKFRQCLLFQLSLKMVMVTLFSDLIDGCIVVHWLTRLQPWHAWECRAGQRRKKTIAG